MNQASNRHSLIMLTAEILVALYRSGWEPMTPIDLSVKGKTQNQTAICFRRDSPEDEYVHGAHATGFRKNIYRVTREVDY